MRSTDLRNLYDLPDAVQLRNPNFFSADANRPAQSPEFHEVQQRAAKELKTTLYYRRIDVRCTETLNREIADIAESEGRLDGLMACAGIQQETPALDYTAEDANRMFEVNVTGTFMTAQAVAKQMIRFGNGGSMAFVGSMSGTVANRVCLRLLLFLLRLLLFRLLCLRPLLSPFAMLYIHHVTSG